MDQLNNYSDSRLLFGCIYCGGLEETRDHVPSKVFLDSPFPENLPVVPACLNCNNGFSLDEEYVACLIESIVAGSVDPVAIRRKSIAKKLKENVSLYSRIATGMSQSNGQTFFQVESERVRNIALKLARGHAAFELGLPFRSQPIHIQCEPLSTMSVEDLEQFESPQIPIIIDEVGSRSLQRLRVIEVTLQSDKGEKFTHSYICNDWIDVQDGRYRYLATSEPDGARVRIVIGEFLACDIKWSI